MAYDVVIVGAGPAGGMAARPLSKKGYKVLLIDRRKVIGHPVQCGGGIGKLALENNGLKEDEDWIKCRIKGAKIFCPNGKFLYITTKPGYSIDRTKFDQWIVNDALDNGAQLVLNSTVKSIKKRGDLWIVKTLDEEYESRIVIGADGAGSNIAKWLGLLKSKEYLKGLQYVFSAKDVDYPEKEHFVLYASTRFNSGYGWVFPRGDGYNVGVGSFVPVKSMLKDFCKSLRFDIGKKIKTQAGIIPYHYELSSLVRDGAVIVGDAAGMTNPMSGGGIYGALFSGRVAGEVSCEALSKENLGLLKEYERTMKSSPFLDPVLYKMGQLAIKWTDETLCFIGDMIEGQDQSKMSYWHGLKKMLAQPRYLLFARQFLMMKKAMLINQDYGW